MEALRGTRVRVGGDDARRLRVRDLRARLWLERLAAPAPLAHHDGPVLVERACAKVPKKTEDGLYDKLVPK
eukprot:3164249-Pleurochrysis_carterae.AAC.1